MVEVVALRGEPVVNESAIREAEEMVARLRAGETFAVAIVEHKRGDVVSTFVSEGRASYHQLTSGAARLAHMLAGRSD